MNRNTLNEALLFSVQGELIDKFKAPHCGVRVKNRRICAMKDGRGFLFKFEYAKKWRKKVMCIALSQEALDAMTFLVSDINNKEYAESVRNG